MSDELPTGVTQADVDQMFTEQGFYTVAETLNHIANICGSGKMKREPERLLISAHHHIECLKDQIEDIKQNANASYHRAELLEDKMRKINVWANSKVHPIREIVRNIGKLMDDNPQQENEDG